MGDKSRESNDTAAPSLERRLGCRLPPLCVAAAVLCVVSMVATLVAVGQAPVRISVELAGPGSITGQGSIQPLPPTAAHPYIVRAVYKWCLRAGPKPKATLQLPTAARPRTARAGGAPSTSMAPSAKAVRRRRRATAAASRLAGATSLPYSWYRQTVDSRQFWSGCCAFWWKRPGILYTICMQRPSTRNIKFGS